MNRYNIIVFIAIIVEGLILIGYNLGYWDWDLPKIIGLFCSGLIIGASLINLERIDYE